MKYLHRLPVCAGSFLWFGFWLLVTIIPPPLPQGEWWSAGVLDSSGELLRVYPNASGQVILPVDDNAPVPDVLKNAVIRFEDRRFYTHFGIDYAAILRAAWQNLTSGKKISGASTLSMQVARMTLGGGRTVWNKIREMVFALQLETHYSKNKILQIYLSLAPYGKNIRGVVTASYRIFGKPLINLTASEAALLAVLPNSPGVLTLEESREGLLEKRNRLLESMKNAGLLSPQEWALAIGENFPKGYVSFPLLAPHFTDRVAQPGKLVPSTLDRDIQMELERQASFYAKYLKTLSVRNMAVIIAETQSGKVRGYLGNPDYFDVPSQGFVDGAAASRSTGSLLKPFLYALCLDQGFFTVSSQIKDVPSYFGSFSPSNADLDFRGMVTISQALVNSLNIPAVHTLKAYKVDRFKNFLTEAGMTTLFRPPEMYGLTLILGGAEGRLDELTGLFASLGRLGIFKPLIFDERKNNVEGRPLISAFASYQILDQLKELSRPESESFWKLYASSKPIAWKTGTSYGQRDAWAIGTTPEWTVGVWIGNFDSDENANLRSAALAGPMLFNLFQYLNQTGELSWFNEPQAGFRTVEVCTATGYLATEQCPVTHEEKITATVHSLQSCPYHKYSYIDDTTGLEVCSACWTPGQYSRISVLLYPPDVMTWMAQSGQSVPLTYAHNPGCSAKSVTGNVAVVYPPHGALLSIPVDFGGVVQKVTLKAAATNTDSLLYWYLDGEYLGTTKRLHEIAVDLNRGNHSLSVTDETGITAVSKFEVK